MILPVKYPDKNLSRRFQDRPPVAISRYAGIYACMQMYNATRERVLSHVRGYFFERGREGKIARRRVNKWLIKHGPGAIKIAIGADGWPIEIIS